MNMIQRPALGEKVPLGTFYDARTDSFISLPFFKSDIPSNEIVTNHTSIIESSGIKSDTYADRFKLLKIHPDLTASILGDLVQVNGSAQYLTAARATDTKNVVQGAIVYSLISLQEELNIMSSSLKEHLAFTTLKEGGPTHVVTAIYWGSQSVITARNKTSKSGVSANDVGDLEAHFERLNLGNRSTEDAGVALFSPEEPSSPYEFDICCDLFDAPELKAADFQSVQNFTQNIPNYIGRFNGGKGVPVYYKLLPLSVLGIMNLIHIESEDHLHQPGAESLDKFVDLFDEIATAEAALKSYRQRLDSHKAGIPQAHIVEVATLLNKSNAATSDLKFKFGLLLKEVRKGQTNPHKLLELLDSYNDSPTAPRRLTSLMVLSPKLEFMDEVMTKGAIYLGYQTGGVQDAVINSQQKEVYVFHYNENVKESHLWTPTYNLLMELLHDSKTDSCIFVADSDALGDELEAPVISQYRDKKSYVSDLLELRRTLANNCVMRYREDAVDKSLKEKPLERRAMKISCPNKYCNRNIVCNWICQTCQGVVEYGYTDELLYCECGATHYSEWEFKCKDTTHGVLWDKYDDAIFQGLLKSLEPFKELNILILGETGVGKSTWINAFVNYLTHDILDEALDSDGPKCIIPCSFTTQVKDNGKFTQRTIKIGSSDSENDGSKGASATQKTSVYPIDVGNTRIRLIDTPGIGDTRGVDQDNANMDDILRVLRSYSKLHGILILLKPNASRLTVMFRFCIKQLLTHLHRNAANNIVFGFTNTRGSNYTPGDTFQPLESLLQEHKEAKMGLFENNVYCFDSESFRYLAARKKGIEMGHLEDNQRSWDYSVTEAKRLTDHLNTLKPHEIRSTINLNEIRNLILNLMGPMARIAQKIQATIAVNEDQINDLTTKTHTRSELMKKLYVQIESLESVPVDKPRTVCTHSDCVEVRSDFEGREEQTIIYKTFCHRPCYLNGVATQVKGDPHIRDCAAMRGQDNCQRCGHHWMDHMHIYNEYKSRTYQKTDEDVQQHLGRSASAIEIQRRAIEVRENAIKEFQLEYHQVQEAAIQFGFFLKRHAITPYNDATVEYLQHLIDQEKIKIDSGGNRKALENLELHKSQYTQKVKVLEAAMSRGENDSVLDDNGILATIQGLYGLTHFGPDLQAMAATNQKAQEACYREKSCNIFTRSAWGSNSGTGSRRGGYNNYRSRSSTNATSSSSSSYSAVTKRGMRYPHDNTTVDLRRPMSPTVPPIVPGPTYAYPKNGYGYTVHEEEVLNPDVSHSGGYYTNSNTNMALAPMHLHQHRPTGFFSDVKKARYPRSNNLPRERLLLDLILTSKWCLESYEVYNLGLPISSILSLSTTPKSPSVQGRLKDVTGYHSPSLLSFLMIFLLTYQLLVFCKDFRRERLIASLILVLPLELLWFRKPKSSGMYRTL